MNQVPEFAMGRSAPAPAEVPSAARRGDGTTGRNLFGGANWEPLYPVATEFTLTYSARIRAKIAEASVIVEQMEDRSGAQVDPLALDGLLFACARQAATAARCPPRRVEDFLQFVAAHLHYTGAGRLADRNAYWLCLNTTARELAVEPEDPRAPAFRRSLRRMLRAQLLRSVPVRRVIDELCDTVVAEVEAAACFLRSRVHYFVDAGGPPAAVCAHS